MKRPSTLTIVMTVMAALGGAAAFATYLESRRERALREEVLKLDKQLKQLELSKSSNKLRV